jgi:hypothetical protein
MASCAAIVPHMLTPLHFSHTDTSAWWPPSAACHTACQVAMSSYGTPQAWPAYLMGPRAKISAFISAGPLTLPCSQTTRRW